MVIRLARRLALLTLLWWVISGGGAAWAWGLPAILVTALVMPSSGAARLRPLALRGLGRQLGLDQPRRLVRAVASAVAGSSGQGCLG